MGVERAFERARKRRELRAAGRPQLVEYTLKSAPLKDSTAATVGLANGGKGFADRNGGMTGAGVVQDRHTGYATSKKK
jgi:hypothetical protein